MLTLEETKKRIEKMLDDNLAQRQAIGVEGDNPEYVTLINALAHLG